MIHVSFIDDFLEIKFPLVQVHKSMKMSMLSVSLKAKKNKNHLNFLLWDGLPTKPHHQSQLTSINETIPILVKPQSIHHSLLAPLTLSNTLNASRMSSSWFWSWTFNFIIIRNSGKSMEPVPSLSTMFIRSWIVCRIL